MQSQNQLPLEARGPLAQCHSATHYRTGLIIIIIII